MLPHRNQAPASHFIPVLAWHMSDPAGRPGESKEVRRGHRDRGRGSGGLQGYVGSTGQGRLGIELPQGHRAGLALPCWGRQLEGSKYSAGRPGHIPGRPARPACPLL